MSLLVSQAHVHRFVNVLHFQTAHVPRPNVYCTAVYGLSGTGYWSVWVCDGTVAGTSTCSGTWGAIACGPSPESLVSSAAVRHYLAALDVSLPLSPCCACLPG
jgi:hypothetical protein